MKSFRYLERIVKGFSNHRRIQILELVYNNPGLSLAEIADKLKINMKTASEHIRRLTIAGLVHKKNKGSAVCHTITPRGLSILKFLRRLE